jgi:hypothetical protein
MAGSGGLSLWINLEVRDLIRMIKTPTPSLVSLLLRGQALHSQKCNASRNI